MTDHHRPEMPVNAIPWVVVGLFAIVAIIEGTLALADAGLVGGAQGIGWRLNALQTWGFSPALWDLIMHRGNRDPEVWRRFVTYLFVHGSTTQALFGAAILLALGKFVGEAFSALATLIVFLGSGVIGAAVYGAAMSDNIALFGCYPGTYGLIGAFTYLTWLRLGRMGQNQLRAFRLIGVLMAMQLLFALLFGSQPSWIADLAGFAAGLLLSPLVAPGGLAALLARMRSR